MKKIICIKIVLLFSFYISYSQNQGISNNWLMGYSSSAGYPFGNTKFDFGLGVISIALNNVPMQFNHTHANISDSAGNMLFYTNGFYIADATNDTMLNGTGINPGAYANNFSDGFGIAQGALIVKKPDNDSLYYVFHSSVDNYPTGNGSIARYLYLTTINIKQNSGLGMVISKNAIVISDSLNTGKIAATKHANGRDWWVMVHRVNTNMFYKLLVTPYGVQGPFSQNMGSIRFWDAGQAWFSPDGTRFAYFYRNGGLDIFDFDRCTGDLSNPVYINIPPESGFNVGMAISPNSDVLYVSNVFHVYQFDLTAANIASTQTTVAAYDSFLSVAQGWPGFPTVFGLGALAPDGKIYLTTGNGTLHLHVIDAPDNLGVSCNVIQHGIQLPAYYFNTLPNHPNYFLGPEIGSVCDSLPHVGLSEQSTEPPPKVFPNPSNGKFTLWFNVHNKHGILQVYDIHGNLILQESVAQWSQYKQVDITNHASGIYFVKMSWGTGVGSVKVIKE